MDTTQKNREEAAQHPPRQAAPAQPRKKPQGSAKAPAAGPKRKAPAGSAAAAVKSGKAPARKRRPEPEISDRKRSYGKTKPKKKTPLDNAADIYKRTAQTRKAAKR